MLDEIRTWDPAKRAAVLAIHQQGTTCYDRRPHTDSCLLEPGREAELHEALFGSGALPVPPSDPWDGIPAPDEPMEH